MDEIIERYNSGKFQKCLELVKLLPKTEDLVINLLRENCLVVCESVVRHNMIALVHNDFDKIILAQEKLYLFFDKVTSLGEISMCIPFELKLTVTFNFFFWLLFYNGDVLKAKEKEEYLTLIYSGLLKVVGNNSSKPSAAIIDKIIETLHVLRKLISKKDFKTGILISELITIVLLYIIKFNKKIINQCAKIVNLFVSDLKQSLITNKSVTNFFRESTNQFCLFKFGLEKTATLLENESIHKTDYLYILESCLLYLAKDYEGSLLSLQKNCDCSVSCLQNYLGALNSFELGNFNLCLGFLTKASSLVMPPNLNARFCIIRGKLKSLEKNHKEALKYFENALTLCPDIHLTYYYVAQEYCKMGLHDIMLKNIKKLAKALEFCKLSEFHFSFKSLLLDWIHCNDEITDVSVSYVLATSYALNEKFDEASEALDKTLQQLNISKIEQKKGIMAMPPYVTILHDASIMSLLTGNLIKSERLALDASDYYVSKEFTKKPGFKKNSFCKDIDWLQKSIKVELLGNNSNGTENQAEVPYQEDLIFFFPQNMIALLIISEIQRIQGAENYNASLSKVLSIFSSYLSSTSLEETINEEKHAWILVKALASKVCVKTALLLVKLNDEVNVEKMFKRALASNRGDKDALYNYFMFLISKKRNREAFKLWHTFYKEKPLIKGENVHSFALKYLLADRITKQELAKVQDKVDSMITEF